MIFKTISGKGMTGFDNFFKSAFTVDNVIFGFDEGNLKVLLIKRGEAPDKGMWALPGYFCLLYTSRCV